MFQLTNSYHWTVTSRESYTGSTDCGYDVTHIFYEIPVLLISS